MVAPTQPAIPAAKNRIGNALIYWFLIHLPLWNHFASVRFQAHGRIPLPTEGPLICYMNHPSWWDGYMAAIISRHILRWGAMSHYVMMEEQQLRSYRFFTWSGVFSVDRHNPREAARSVAYISRVLQEGVGRVLYLFPQGEITPNDRRPLHIYPGIAHIVRRIPHGTLLAPVALRYEFRGEQRPELFLRFGPVHRADPSAEKTVLLADVQQRLTHSVDALHTAIIADDMRQFRVLMRGKPGINRLVDVVSPRD